MADTISSESGSGTKLALGTMALTAVFNAGTSYAKEHLKKKHKKTFKKMLKKTGKGTWIAGGVMLAAGITAYLIYRQDEAQKLANKISSTQITLF